MYFHSCVTGDFIDGNVHEPGSNRRGATSWRDGFTLKTLSPRYLSDTAATAVSSLSIPLSTLIGIETKNSLEQAARKNTFWRQISALWGNSRPHRTSGGLHLFCEWLDFEDLTVSAERG